MDQEQLDRIERKLDDILAFRDLVLRLALPKIPAAMREKAAAVMAAGRRPS